KTLRAEDRVNRASELLGPSPRLPFRTSSSARTSAPHFGRRIPLERVHITDTFYRQPSLSFITPYSSTTPVVAKAIAIDPRAARYPQPHRPLHIGSSSPSSSHERRAARCFGGSPHRSRTRRASRRIIGHRSLIGADGKDRSWSYSLAGARAAPGAQ